jgi:hypothetical protein
MLYIVDRLHRLAIAAAMKAGNGNYATTYKDMFVKVVKRDLSMPLCWQRWNYAQNTLTLTREMVKLEPINDLSILLHYYDCYYNNK